MRSLVRVARPVQLASRRLAVRSLSTISSRQQQHEEQQNKYHRIGAVGAIAVAFVGGYIASERAQNEAKAEKPAGAAAPKPGGVDYAALREAIVKILDKEGYDDGSIGPVLVRLAWHASGTYDVKSRTGGSNGATMRFEPESKDGANNGLDKARAFLEPIKQQFPGVSYADLWTFAASVAIEEMGGPKINWRPGRTDASSGAACPPQGRLPDASKKADHVRDVFYRMGLNDQEIVALAGAHALGRCHTDRSGYTGPWTRAPTTFSNLYFKELLENKWTEKKWNGPKQFEDPTGELMMTPADMAFVEDPKFKEFVVLYAKDQNKFFADFAAAWKKLIEFNVPAFAAAPAAAPAPVSSGIPAAAPAKPADKPAEKSWWSRIFG